MDDPRSCQGKRETMTEAHRVFALFTFLPLLFLYFCHLRWNSTCAKYCYFVFLCQHRQLTFRFSCLKQSGSGCWRRLSETVFHIFLLGHSYLFINSCASRSNLWGSVFTFIGCSTTSWFLMRMQFQVGINLKGIHHRTVARILTKKSTTSKRRLMPTRPQPRTKTWKCTLEKYCIREETST